MQPGEVITIGGDHADATEPHRTWYQLSEANQSLTRRVHDLEADNAELRTKLTRAMAQLHEAQVALRANGIEL